jgi:hypothetical protein
MLNKLEPGREIRLGRRSGVLGWIDGSKIIWIHRQTFAGFCKHNPIASVFYMRAIPLLAHELTHDNDNRETDYHGYQFEKENLEMIEELLNRASKLSEVKNGGQ